jgi:hypothetical protein
MTMPKAPTTGSRDRLSMSCDIESRMPSPERRAAHHRDCVRPDRCPCAAHDRDEVQS